jgi:hydrogenase-4 component B
MAGHLFIISIILYVVGYLFALCFFRWQKLRNYISPIFVAIASCFSIAVAVIVLADNSVYLDFPLLLPIIPCSFLLDPLSSYFVLAISVICLIPVYHNEGIELRGISSG